MNSEEYCSQALKEMECQNYTVAQHIFERAVSDCTDSIAFHNLGYFYLTYGCGKCVHYNAPHKGLKYLRKSASLNTHYQNLAVLGRWHFMQRNYTKAERYFLNAYRICPSYICAYHLGITEYMQHNFVDAQRHLKIASDICKKSDDIQRIALAQAYVLLAMNKTDISDVTRLISSLSDFDSFPILYLSGMLEYALPITQHILDEYLPTITEFSMILDTLISTCDSSMAKNAVDEYVQLMPGSKIRVCALHCFVHLMYKNDALRKAVARHHRIQLPLLDECLWIGCPKHK